MRQTVDTPTKKKLDFPTFDFEADGGGGGSGGRRRSLVSLFSNLVEAGGYATKHGT